MKKTPKRKTVKTTKKAPARKPRAVSKPEPRPATATEVATEITELKRLAPLIPQHDLFGGNNRAKIEAEIEALEKNMNEGDVYDRFAPTPVDYDEETGEGTDESLARDIDHDEGRGDEIEDCARSAVLWRDGESREKPSDGWIELVKP